METDTIAGEEVVLNNDRVAPSITSTISLLLLEMETPSTVNEASVPASFCFD